MAIEDESTKHNPAGPEFLSAFDPYELHNFQNVDDLKMLIELGKILEAAIERARPEQRALFYSRLALTGFDPGNSKTFQNFADKQLARSADDGRRSASQIIEALSSRFRPNSAPAPSLVQASAVGPAKMRIRMGRRS